jgi:hypothetical protein
MSRLSNVTSFPPFVNNDALLDRQSSVAATYNRVKTFFEIHFSLRDRSERRADSACDAVVRQDHTRKCTTGN